MTQSNHIIYDGLCQVCDFEDEMTRDRPADSLLCRLGTSYCGCFVGELLASCCLASCCRGVIRAVLPFLGKF